jgi:hypothetical protein
MAQQVNDLRLAFIAPLNTYNDGTWHVRRVYCLPEGPLPLNSQRARKSKRFRPTGAPTARDCPATAYSVFKELLGKWLGLVEWFRVLEWFGFAAFVFTGFVAVFVVESTFEAEVVEVGLAERVAGVGWVELGVVVGFALPDQIERVFGWYGGVAKYLRLECFETDRHNQRGAGP